MHIGTLSFPADQQQKLARILELSKHQRYELVEFDAHTPPDLLLLFGADAMTDPELESLPEAYRSRMVQVSKLPPEDKGLGHIRYPLISSRVIRTLDDMTSENEELTPEELEAATSTDNRFSKYENVVASTISPTTESGGYRVLVVDDNSSMQQALRLELEKLPATIELVYADSGEQALEQIVNDQFDFIFLDVLMPGIDGFETCTRMREIPRLKKTPIIMLTSKTSPLDEVKGIMAGCSTYLTKPIDHEEFQKVITRVSGWVDEFKQD
ncbi:response regulator [Amphritea japonica]|uniref:Twitching motility two-component system response regulator PilG n=1 Tax=Amphritea japonica ATCC BAA-1530 TaxID=1278309 RepID=A0A7R6PK43_9GAMM|nr:response regulator [Amphritea japonica]BBB27927.1 twitching motility two-component system response regulator PilG [Amphritea japonica ATCC BAA-1530]